MRRLFLFSFLHFCLFLISQTVTPTPSDKGKEEKAFCYNDTLFSLNGAKIEVHSARSTWDKFKCTLEIQNTTKNYLIIDPYDIRGHIGSSEKSFHDKKEGMIVVAPNETKKFKIKFSQFDFLQPVIEIRADKICYSDTVASVYDMPDMDISMENQRKIAPVQWAMTNKDYDVHRGVRVSGKLKYRGDKFLRFFPDNATLKTTDGNFNSIAEGNGIIAHYNDPYYDRFDNFEKTVFIFPTKRNALKKGSKSILNLNGVFKEYSIKKSEGFTITLRKDPNGKKSKTRDEDDAD
jgi:hypothetical protein